MLEEAGLIEQREGRFELTPAGIRKIGRNALERPVPEAGPGQDGPPRARAHRRRPRAGLRDQALRVRRPVQPRTSSARSATRSAGSGGGTPGAAHARRLRGRAHRAPRPLEHRADARPVAVDADARQLPRRQEGGDGAALADLDAVPARLPRHRRLQRGGPRDQARRTLPEVSWDFVYGTNMQHGFLLSPAAARPPERAPSRSS